jgi:hypothetical protein
VALGLPCTLNYSSNSSSGANQSIFHLCTCGDELLLFVC